MASRTWDRRYLELAQLVASWSKDPSTHVGAVIVRPDLTIASTGFNGFPRRMDDKAEWYEDREVKYSRIIHAEINALVHALERVAGYTLYTWPMLPCDRCAVQVIQAGIGRVVAPMPRTTLGLSVQERALHRWQVQVDTSCNYFAECGIPVHHVDMEG
jgi:dCMP deaminase